METTKENTTNYIETNQQAPEMNDLILDRFMGNIKRELHVADNQQKIRKKSILRVSERTYDSLKTVMPYGQPLSLDVIIDSIRNVISKAKSSKLRWMEFQRRVFGGEYLYTLDMGLQSIVLLGSQKGDFQKINAGVIVGDGIPIDMATIAYLQEDRPDIKIHKIHKTGCHELKQVDLDHSQPTKQEKPETTVVISEPINDSNTLNASKTQSVLGYVITGTSNENCYFQADSSQTEANIVGKFGILSYAGDKVLICVTKSQLDGKYRVKEGVDSDFQNFGDRFKCEAKYWGTKSGNAVTNVAYTSTEIVEVNPRDHETMKQFYHTSNIRLPLHFLTAVEFPLEPPVDLFKWHQNAMIIGITRCGKGYFANSYLAAAQGYPFPDAKGNIKPMGILYFDSNGQWNQEGGNYDFFEPTGPFPRPTIYDIRNINPQTMLDHIWDRFHLSEFGWAARNVRNMRLFLRRTPITRNTNFDEFMGLLYSSIERAYNGRNIIEKQNRIEDESINEDWETRWDTIIEEYNQFNQNLIPIQDVITQLRNGEFIVIDSSPLKAEALYEATSTFIENLVEEAIEIWRNNDTTDYSFPALVVIDEIHNLCPDKGDSSLTTEHLRIKRLLEQWASQFAKYGTFLMGISQYPKQVSKELLRNIEVKIVGKISEKGDRKTIEDNWGVEIPNLPNYQFVLWNGGVTKFGNKLMKVKSWKPEDFRRRN